MLNQDEFIGLFTISKLPHFIKQTPFKSEDIGFSLLLNYSSEVLNKISPDNLNYQYKCLVRVFIKEEDKEKKKPNIGLSIYTIFLKDDELLMTSFNHAHAPINLYSNHDYIYDIENNQLYKGDNRITGVEIINEIYSKHIKTSEKLNGLLLRSKINLRNLSAKSLSLVAKYSSLTHKFIYKEDIPYDYFTKYIQVKNDIHSEALKEERVEEVSFGGFNASYRVIILFCMIHFSTYLVLNYYQIRPRIIVEILTNNFLTLVYTVIILSILEYGIKYFSRLFIQKISYLQERVEYMPLKV